MLDESTVAVRFVDYGDCSMVAIENLQVLWAQFRNLPMQVREILNKTRFNHSLN